MFIGLGSNLGDGEANCVRALLLVSRFASVEAVSPVYKTEPVGVGDGQPFFTNAVALIGCGHRPEKLLSELQSVEKQLGRTEKGNNRPRIIDMDILFHGETVVENRSLKIPHPLAHSRRFVLEPMNKIAPNFVHPVLGKTIAELLGALDEKTSVEMIESRFFPFGRIRRGQKSPPL